MLKEGIEFSSSRPTQLEVSLGEPDEIRKSGRQISMHPLMRGMQWVNYKSEKDVMQHFKRIVGARSVIEVTMKSVNTTSPEQQLY